MRVDLFDFELPPERIAQRPARPRDAARLLRVPAAGAVEDRLVRDLPALLQPGDLLVANDTRVLPARLVGRRGELKVEALLLRRLGDGSWNAMARPAKRLRPGERLVFADGLAAEVRGKRQDGTLDLGFEGDPKTLNARLEAHGGLPIPPYIRGGAADAQDRADYQTTYARRDGAVAAPTAGLHFTPALFDALDARGVRRAFVTLHVGAGTFQPVRVDDTDAHRMASEWGEVGAEAAQAIAETRGYGGRIVAVGTTALRLLETAARDGDGEVRPWRGDTDIFIAPGFRFRAVDLLLTNFHLPRSTLFMLVSAFAGLERMKAAYAHAVSEGYRFYSYGDASLLERAEETR